MLHRHQRRLRPRLTWQNSHVTTTAPLPEQLAEIRDDFLALEQRDRLQLLLEFSNELPELPERYRDHPDLFERVEECQSPVFLFVEVDDSGAVQPLPIV